jgi:hypothetical protein
MDDNRFNDNENQNKDRWNSSASNSSYLNQPVHRPYDEAFSRAALFMGVAATALGTTGLSLPVGALGILFVALAYRHGKPINGNANFGLWLCVIGIFTGLAVLGYTFFVQIPALLEDPSSMQNLEDFYRTLFGADASRILQNQ